MNQKNTLTTGIVSSLILVAIITLYATRFSFKEISTAEQTQKISHGLIVIENLNPNDDISRNQLMFVRDGKERIRTGPGDWYYEHINNDEAIVYGISYNRPDELQMFLISSTDKHEEKDISQLPGPIHDISVDSGGNYLLISGQEHRNEINDPVTYYSCVIHKDKKSYTSCKNAETEILDQKNKYKGQPFIISWHDTDAEKLILREIHGEERVFLYDAEKDSIDQLLSDTPIEDSSKSLQSSLSISGPFVTLAYDNKHFGIITSNIRKAKPISPTEVLIHHDSGVYIYNFEKKEKRMLVNPQWEYVDFSTFSSLE